MEKGIFGCFSGKIGNVVGYVRGGKQFIRSKPEKRQTVTALHSNTYFQSSTLPFFHTRFKVCLKVQPPSPVP